MTPGAPPSRLRQVTTAAVASAGTYALWTGFLWALALPRTTALRAVAFMLSQFTVFGWLLFGFLTLLADWALERLTNLYPRGRAAQGSGGPSISYALVCGLLSLPTAAAAW